jgi:hypothetical protein
MDVELPNDWRAIRRLHHQQSNTSINSVREEEEPVMAHATQKTEKKRKVTHEYEDGTDDHEPKKKVDEQVKNGPLGPRGVFNAITHDLPEKGQLKQIVMMQLGKGKHEEKEEDEELQMEVHCLLSKLPYQKMLSDLFSSQSNNNNNDRDLLPNPNIPYVTRVYEESFMREPLNSTERLCAKGEQCECMFIDQENPFTSIEFLLPGERQPPTPHLCVVCCRAVTQQLYYDIMFDKHDFGGVIQRFGNIHSQPGEYSLDAMLIAAPNVALHIMPLPIVSHQRNRYSVVIKRGIKHSKQSRVYFQSTPSCTV